MQLPNPTDLIIRYLPHIGWGSVIAACGSVIAMCAKIYQWGSALMSKADLLITNHARHIEDYSRQSAENTFQLLGYAKSADTNNQTLVQSINDLSQVVSKLDGRLEK